MSKKTPEPDYEKIAADLYRKIKQTDYPSSAKKLMEDEFRRVVEEEVKKVIKSVRVSAIVTSQQQKKIKLNGNTVDAMERATQCQS